MRERDRIYQQLSQGAMPTLQRQDLDLQMRDMENNIVGVEQKIFMLEQAQPTPNRYWLADLRKKESNTDFNAWVKEKEMELDSLHNQTIEHSRVDDVSSRGTETARSSFMQVQQHGR